MIQASLPLPLCKKQHFYCSSSFSSSLSGRRRWTNLHFCPGIAREEEEEEEEEEREVERMPGIVRSRRERETEGGTEGGGLL